MKHWKLVALLFLSEIIFTAYSQDPVIAATSKSINNNTTRIPTTSPFESSPHSWSREPIECLEGNGTTYRGKVNVTQSGIPCQQWNTHDPHKSNYTPEKYPHADLGNNYCRNPHIEPRTWCYTTNSSKRWEYCRIRNCSDVNCMIGIRKFTEDRSHKLQDDVQSVVCPQNEICVHMHWEELSSGKITFIEHGFCYLPNISQTMTCDHLKNSSSPGNVFNCNACMNPPCPWLAYQPNCSLAPHDDLKLLPSCTLRETIDRGAYECVEPFLENFPFYNQTKCRLSLDLAIDCIGSMMRDCLEGDCPTAFDFIPGIKDIYKPLLPQDVENDNQLYFNISSVSTTDIVKGREQDLRHPDEDIVDLKSFLKVLEVDESFTKYVYDLVCPIPGIPSHVILQNLFNNIPSINISNPICDDDFFDDFIAVSLDAIKNLFTLRSHIEFCRLFGTSRDKAVEMWNDSCNVHRLVEAYPQFDYALPKIKETIDIVLKFLNNFKLPNCIIDRKDKTEYMCNVGEKYFTLDHIYNRFVNITKVKCPSGNVCGMYRWYQNDGTEKQSYMERGFCASLDGISTKACDIDQSKQNSTEDVKCSFDYCQRNYCNQFTEGCTHLVPSGDVGLLPNCSLKQSINRGYTCFTPFLGNYPFYNQSQCNSTIDKAIGCISFMIRDCWDGNCPTTVLDMIPQFRHTYQEIRQDLVSVHDLRSFLSLFEIDQSVAVAVYDAMCPVPGIGNSSVQELLKQLVDDFLPLNISNPVCDNDLIDNLIKLVLGGVHEFSSLRTHTRFCRMFETLKGEIISMLNNQCDIDDLFQLIMDKTPPEFHKLIPSLNTSINIGLKIFKNLEIPNCFITSGSTTTRASSTDSMATTVLPDSGTPAITPPISKTTKSVSSTLRGIKPDYSHPETTVTTVKESSTIYADVFSSDTTKIDFSTTQSATTILTSSDVKTSTSSSISSDVFSVVPTIGNTNTPAIPATTALLSSTRASSTDSSATTVLPDSATTAITPPTSKTNISVSSTLRGIKPDSSHPEATVTTARESSTIHTNVFPSDTTTIASVSTATSRASSTDSSATTVLPDAATPAITPPINKTTKSVSSTLRGIKPDSSHPEATVTTARESSTIHTNVFPSDTTTIDSSTIQNATTLLRNSDVNPRTSSTFSSEVSSVVPTIGNTNSSAIPATTDNKCFSNNCSSNSYCHGTDSSYKCTCWKGFTGDGFHCIKLLHVFKNSIKIMNVSNTGSAAAVVSDLNEIVSSYNASQEDYQSIIIPTLDSIVSAAIDGSFEVKPSFLDPVVDVLSKITKSYFKPKKMGTARNITERAEKDNLIKSVTGLARALKFKGDVFEKVTESLTVKVQKYNETSGQGLTANFSSVNVKLPYESLKKQRRTKRKTDEEFAAFFVLFDDTILFDTGDVFDVVISIDVGEPGSVKNLDTPVTIEHKVDTHPGRQTNPDKPAEVTNTELKCVFWDDKTSDWASNGCCLKPDTDPPQCSCDHLTSFALLVSEKVSTDVVLDLVSDIGCYLSIFGLFFSIIIHLYFRASRKQRQTQFLIHICFNLIVAYSLFVGGISRAANKTVCNVVAALLHYFFLTSWCWMVVYCYEMRRKILEYRDLPKRYTQKTVVFSYGIPMVLVATTAIATLGVLDQKQPSLYCDEVSDPLAPSLYRSENYCWIHGYPLLIGFLLPVAIMLFYNIIVFIEVVKRLNSMEISTADGSSPKHTAGTAITLTAVVGVGWGFGYLILIAPESKFAAIFSWFFAAFVVLQGVAIFVMTIVQCKVLKHGSDHNENSEENSMIQLSSSSSSNEVSPAYDIIDEKSKSALDEKSKSTSALDISVL